MHLRFVDRDMLMRYHWGYGVGHTYSHFRRDSNSDSESLLGQAASQDCDGPTNQSPETEEDGGDHEEMPMDDEEWPQRECNDDKGTNTASPSTDDQGELDFDDEGNSESGSDSDNSEGSSSSESDDSDEDGSESDDGLDEMYGDARYIDCTSYD